MDVVRASQALTAPRPPRPPEAPRPEAPEASKTPAKAPAPLGAQVEEGIVVEPGLLKAPAAGETEGASQGGLEARISGMVEELNSRLGESRQTRLRFDIDSESGVIVIQVVDKATDEVVRSIPPEEMIALKKHMTEMRGILFDHEG